MSLLRHPVWQPSRRLTVVPRSRPTRLGPGNQKASAIEEEKESAPAPDQKRGETVRGERGKGTKIGGEIALGVSALGCIGRLRIRPSPCTGNHQAAIGISLIE